MSSIVSSILGSSIFSLLQTKKSLFQTKKVKLLSNKSTKSNDVGILDVDYNKFIELYNTNKNKLNKIIESDLSILYKADYKVDYCRVSIIKDTNWITDQGFKLFVPVESHEDYGFSHITVRDRINFESDKCIFFNSSLQYRKVADLRTQKLKVLIFHISLK